MRSSRHIPFPDAATYIELGGIDSVDATISSILKDAGVSKRMFSLLEIDAIRTKQNLLLFGVQHRFRPDKSIAFHFSSLFEQMSQLQDELTKPHLLGAMLQHLVGAKLDIVLGVGVAEHHGHSVADQPTDRQADFEVNGVAIHVTTHPSEALMRKAAKNLQSGLKPLIVTLADGVEGAAYLLKNTEWKDRIDVIDAGQFLTANVYERSLFQVGECKATLASILSRYNEIIETCETDPVLKIQF